METMLKDTYEARTIKRSSSKKRKEHKFTTKDPRSGPHEESIPCYPLEGEDEEQSKYFMKMKY